MSSYLSKSISPSLSTSLAEFDLGRRCETVARQKPNTKIGQLCRRVAQLLRQDRYWLHLQHIKPAEGLCNSHKVLSHPIENIFQGFSSIDDFVQGNVSSFSQLPQVSRFPATLSVEAQYATMACYENLIEKELEKRKYSSKANNSYSEDAITKYTELKIPTGMKLYRKPFSFNSLTVENQPPRSNRCSKCSILSVQLSSANQSGRSSPSISQDIKRSTIPENNFLLSFSTEEIATSQRLEVAIKILEEIRMEKQNIYRKPTFINPERHFKMWKRAWKKDFYVGLSCKQ